MSTGKTIKKDSSITAQIWFQYIPYWPLFLLLIFLAFAGAFVFLKYAKSYYGVNARILIKDEKKGTVDGKAIESLDMFASKKIIENEVEVIQSRSLITNVVESLHLYSSIVKKKKFTYESLYSNSPIVIQARHPDQIRSTEEIPFHYNPVLKVIFIGAKQYPMDNWVNTPWGVLRFAQVSNHNVNSINNQLAFRLTAIKQVATSIKNSLQVRSVSRSSSVLELTLKDENPQRGEHILNALMKYYNEMQLKDKSSLVATTLGFVESRLVKVTHDLDSIERKIQLYRYNTGIIDISTQGRIFLENVSTVDHQLNEVNMHLAILDQVEEFVLAKDKSNSFVPSTLGVTDPMLSQLVNKLYTAELEYESLRKTTAENNPMLVSVADQIAKIKPSILENIQSQRRSLKISQQNLTGTNNSYVSRLKSLPQTEKDLIDINRQQRIKTEIYNFLLQKREETAFSEAAVVSDSRIIDFAESSDRPVSPKPNVIYLSSLLLALISGVGIVALRENLSGNIQFRHEIEQCTTAPIIGEIAYENSKNMVVIDNERRGYIAEQIRGLRTSLAFLGINTVRKRILITSSISGEGKSFVAVNLAVSLALTGKKVVLVDLDLNLNGPTINEKLNMNAQEGVTEFLQGEAELENIVLKTTFADTLYFISKGKLSKNPTELLLNGRIEQLLSQLDASFDYVVIDTPPVGLVTDAYLVSPYCDATLYIVRHGYTPKVSVERIDDNNKINQLSNLAIVFNGVRARGFGNKKYGYGYGYGYIQKENSRNIKRLKAS